MPDITKGKKKGKRGRFSERIVYHVDAGHINDHKGTPQHSAAEGYTREMAKPDCDKASNYDAESAAVPQTGNPVAHAHSSSGSYAEDRESTPVMAGHAAQSPGNRSNFDRPNGTAYAVGHPDLRQSSTRTVPFQNVGTNNGHFIGEAAFGGMFADTDAPPGAPGNTVRVTRLDMASEAGTYANMQPFDDRPSNAQAAGHMSRNSATPPDGSHSVSGSVTRPPTRAMKNSEALNAVKAAMYGGA
jgi:hypothetical protein